MQIVPDTITIVLTVAMLLFLLAIGLYTTKEWKLNLYLLVYNNDRDIKNLNRADTGSKSIPLM